MVRVVCIAPIHNPDSATHLRADNFHTRQISEIGFLKILADFNLSLSHLFRKGCIEMAMTSDITIVTVMLSRQPYSSATEGASNPARMPPNGTPVKRIEKIKFLFLGVTIFESK